MWGTRKFRVIEDLSIHTGWRHASVEPGKSEKYLSSFNPSWGADGASCQQGCLSWLNTFSVCLEDHGTHLGQGLHSNFGTIVQGWASYFLWDCSAGDLRGTITYLEVAVLFPESLCQKWNLSKCCHIWAKSRYSRILKTVNASAT